MQSIARRARDWDSRAIGSGATAIASWYSARAPAMAAIEMPSVRLISGVRTVNA